MGTGSPPSPRSEAPNERQRLEQKLAETEIPNAYLDFLLVNI